jgi:hypothetical protein
MHMISPLESYLNNDYLSGAFGQMTLSGVDIAAQIQERAGRAGQ